MNVIKLTNEKLDINLISVLIGNCCPISLFVRTKGDNFDNEKKFSLKYGPYDENADRTLKKVCDDIRKKWHYVLNIGIYYRLGLVPNTESNVVIAISSLDDSSLVAVNFAIEELKRSESNWLNKVDENYDEDAFDWDLFEKKCFKSYVKIERLKDQNVSKSVLGSSSASMSTAVALLPPPPPPPMPAPPPVFQPIIPTIRRRRMPRIDVNGKSDDSDLPFINELRNALKKRRKDVKPLTSPTSRNSLQGSPPEKRRKIISNPDTLVLSSSSTPQKSIFSTLLAKMEHFQNDEQDENDKPNEQDDEEIWK